MAFDFRDQLGSGVVVVTSTFEGKNSYFVGITKRSLQIHIKQVS